MDNNFGLSLIALMLLMGLMVVGVSIKSGLTRSAAIEAGMTANEYGDWMDDVN